MSILHTPRQGRVPALARSRRRLLCLLAVAASALVLAQFAAPVAANAAPATQKTASTVSSTTGSSTTGSSTTGNTTPDLWPKLKPFKTLVVADINGGTSDQTLAATSLEGAYNQLQGPNRLYVVRNPDDQTWLNDNVLPKGDTWSALQGIGSGATGQLAALLAGYGKDIKGAILINPSDSDTINLATTMAGVDDAMVAAPSQLPLLQQYGIPVLYSFADTTFASSTAAYQWEYANLFPKTNPKDLVILNPGDYGELRDYIIATKSFVFYLTSTNSAQEPLMNQIIGSRPAETPVMGYVANETPDVADLSSLGDFLNASDLLDNESDWSAVPSLTTALSQPAPQPVRATDNTVYVAFLTSDGDNAQYDEHALFDQWTDAGSYLGEVPEGWTFSAGAADFAPSLISWFYQHLPRDSELLAGPSGVGYATYQAGGDLTKFSQLSGGFMREDSMSTVESYENPSKLAAFAAVSGVPSITTYQGPMVYTKDGKTVVRGLTNGYVTPSDPLLSTIEQDALNGLSGHPSSPVFLEPLVDAGTLDPQDVVAIAQALASWGKTIGENFVFTTPSELALTEEAYQQHTGAALPELNAQTVTGASLLALPSAGSLTGYTAPTGVSGPNLVANPSGADGTAGWTDTEGTLSAGTYKGGPDVTWSVPAEQAPNPTDPGESDEWAHVYPAVTNGDTYTFTVQVAGSGQVFMDVWTAQSGDGDNQTQAVKLGPSYQTLTWTATIPSNAPTGQTGSAPQLQVREIGLGAVTVHIKDATVRLASTSS